MFKKCLQHNERHHPFSLMKRFFSMNH